MGGGQLPVDTDQQAEQFVAATNMCQRWSSLAVFKRYYSITRNPNMPHAAASIVESLGERSQHCHKPDSFWLSQVILLDILKTQPIIPMP